MNKLQKGLAALPIYEHWLQSLEMGATFVDWLNELDVKASLYRPGAGRVAAHMIFSENPEAGYDDDPRLLA